MLFSSSGRESDRAASTRRDLWNEKWLLRIRTSIRSLDECWMQEARRNAELVRCCLPPHVFFQYSRRCSSKFCQWRIAQWLTFLRPICWCVSVWPTYWCRNCVLVKSVHPVNCTFVFPLNEIIQARSQKKSKLHFLKSGCCIFHFLKSKLWSKLLVIRNKQIADDFCVRIKYWKEMNLCTLHHCVICAKIVRICDIF